MYGQSHLLPARRASNIPLILQHYLVVAGAAAALSHFAASTRMELVVVTGSIVLVGEARAILLGLPREPPVPL